VIPVGRNIAYSIGLFFGMPALLWVVCHAESRLAQVGAVVLFAFLGQMLFQAIHEAEHDKLLPGRRWNDLFGTLLSAFFPASFSILRAGHLLHHGRNRSTPELVEYYAPDESRLLRTFNYYAMVFGAIWAGAIATSVLLCFVPGKSFRLPEGRLKRSDIQSFLAFLVDTKPSRIRLETGFTVALWATLVPLLGLDLRAALAYLAMGMVWSSQQFVFHARAPLHVVEGSWDLHMGPFFGPLLLHSNYHLTHHRHPKAPWTALPALAEAPPERSYLTQWLSLFRPPSPLAEATTLAR
jgi:fatty acid desaturase